MTDTSEHCPMCGQRAHVMPGVEGTSAYWPDETEARVALTAKVVQLEAEIRELKETPFDA